MYNVTVPRSGPPSPCSPVLTASRSMGHLLQRRPSSYKVHMVEAGSTGTAAGCKGSWKSLHLLATVAPCAPSSGAAPHLGSRAFYHLTATIDRSEHWRSSECEHRRSSECTASASPPYPQLSSPQCLLASTLPTGEREQTPCCSDASSPSSPIVVKRLFSESRSASEASLEKEREAREKRERETALP